MVEPTLHVKLTGKKEGDSRQQKQKQKEKERKQIWSGDDGTDGLECLHLVGVIDHNNCLGRRETSIVAVGVTPPTKLGTKTNSSHKASLNNMIEFETFSTTMQ